MQWRTPRTKMRKVRQVATIKNPPPKLRYTAHKSTQDRCLLSWNILVLWKKGTQNRPWAQRTCGVWKRSAWFSGVKGCWTGPARCGATTDEDTSGSLFTTGVIKLIEEEDGTGLAVELLSGHQKKAANFLAYDNTCWQRGFCSCWVSDRLFVGSVWMEEAGMEWGVTQAHEEQVWDRGVLCVYPGKKRNRKMGYFKGCFYTTLLSSCDKNGEWKIDKATYRLA